MLYLSVVLLFIFLNIVCDVNYFLRTLFTVLWGRLFESRRNLHDTTTVYDVLECYCSLTTAITLQNKTRFFGSSEPKNLACLNMVHVTAPKYQKLIPQPYHGIGTYQDCDVTLKYVRSARLIRELDMARFHYYELTDIYRRSLELGIHSLQGCTLTVTMEPVPVFTPYKINTKLVYWDDRTVFLEHEVVTLLDGKRRCFLLSRQHVMSDHGHSTEDLFKNLPGSEITPTCPQYIQEWLKSMKITSSKLRKI